MIKEKFIQNRLALIVLVSASLIVVVSMGMRHVFGLFSEFFIRDLQITVTQFGLAIALQMIMWGATAPILGALADKVGVTRQTIFAIEKDKYSPSLKVAFKISNVFKASLEEVFTYD